MSLDKRLKRLEARQKSRNAQLRQLERRAAETAQAAAESNFEQFAVMYKEVILGPLSPTEVDAFIQRTLTAWRGEEAERAQ